MSGLAPFEIFISESQERMTLAVAPEKFDLLNNIATKHGVTISNIGEFTETGNLEAYYQSEMVALIPMNFLHHGNPSLNLIATWRPKPTPKFNKGLTPFRNLEDAILKVLPHQTSVVNKVGSSNMIKKFKVELS